MIFVAEISSANNTYVAERRRKKYYNKAIVSKIRPLFQELTGAKFISRNKAKVSATRPSFQELRPERIRRSGSDGYTREIERLSRRWWWINIHR